MERPDLTTMDINVAKTLVSRNAINSHTSYPIRRIPTQRRRAAPASRQVIPTRRPVRPGHLGWHAGKPSGPGRHVPPDDDRHEPGAPAAGPRTRGRGAGRLDGGWRG